MRTGFFNLLFLAFSLFHVPSPVYGQTVASARQGPLIGAELRVSSYLGNTVPTASLLFYDEGRGFSFGGELSVTLRSVMDQRSDGYLQMRPLVQIGPSFGYAGLLSEQTGYYTAFGILAGVTKIEERSHDVITSGPGFAAGVKPKAGFSFEPGSDLQIRIGTSLWIGWMTWSEERRVLPALTVSALL
jgi:hypothetical protein